MNYRDLDPKKIVGTPKLAPTQTTTPGKKDCILDVINQAFNQVKGVVGEIVGNAKSIFNGAINDVKNFAQGVKDLMNTKVNIEVEIQKISVDGILDDIKNAVKDGIDDAINYGKGILDAAKEARAFLTCQKGTAYERSSAGIDSQLAAAGDESDAAGEAMTRSLFSSSTKGTKTPISPKMRREISNGTPAGARYVKKQQDLAKQRTLQGVQQNARNEYNTLASGNVEGIAGKVNISVYG